MIRTYFISLIVIYPGSSLAQPTIPPPAQTDELIIDLGTSGKADPNDRIRYKVTIMNRGYWCTTQYRARPAHHFLGRHFSLLATCAAR